MMKQTTIKILVAATVATSQTACSSMVGESLFVGDDEGRFLLATDAAGMQAFGDALGGIAQISKDSPDVKGAYWAKRENDNQVRALKWGFKTRGAKK